MRLSVRQTDVERDFNAYALLPLASAVLYALAMIVTRTKCHGEHPLILSGVLNITFIAVGLVGTALTAIVTPYGTGSSFLLATWAPLTNNEVLAIPLLTAVILVTSIGTAIAYQAGRSSVVATFDFAYVGFAVIFGFLLFGEVPDALTIAGISMIVVAGVIAVRR